MSSASPGRLQCKLSFLCLSPLRQDGCVWAPLPAATQYNTPGYCSPEHSQETEHLRGALLSSRSRLQELEIELEHHRVDRQQLLEDLKEKQQEILCFQEERLSLQEKDSR